MKILKYLKNKKTFRKDIFAGFMKVPLTMKNGERWSAERVLKNENANLRILSHALVLKVYTLHSIIKQILFSYNPIL